MAQLSTSLLTDHVIESLATPPTVVHIANMTAPYVKPTRQHNAAA